VPGSTAKPGGGPNLAQRANQCGLRTVRINQPKPVGDKAIQRIDRSSAEAARAGASSPISSTAIGTSFQSGANGDTPALRGGTKSGASCVLGKSVTSSTVAVLAKPPPLGAFQGERKPIRPTAHQGAGGCNPDLDANQQSLFCQACQGPCAAFLPDLNPRSCASWAFIWQPGAIGPMARCDFTDQTFADLHVFGQRGWAAQ